VIVALTSMEETGSSGAVTAAYACAPQTAFVVDVSMAEMPDERPEQCGVLGGGPMIGFAPVLDRALSRLLVDTAKEKNIPFQREIMASRTGTDADAFAISREGVRTGLVSIPLRFMHSPSELLVLSDIEDTARLLAAVIGGCPCWN
jgi:endoglucanase